MKKVLIGISLFLCIFSVYALNKDFKIDSSKISVSIDGRKNDVLNSFASEYKLSSLISSNDKELEEKIINLTRKTTYLLLGEANKSEESSEDYYKRHKDYLNLALYNYYPKDSNTESGYVESNSNYKFAYISEYAVPSVFLKFNELDIIYNNYGDIRVTANDDLVISSIKLSNVKIKNENHNGDRNYNVVNKDLLITYYFVKVDSEYYLAYLFGEMSDVADEYFSELESSETKGMNVAPLYESNLKEIYDYSKLNNLKEKDIANIYNKNKDKIVILNSYYNNYVTNSANGFFINDGLVVTTWNFLEKSLVDAQYISLKDIYGNIYEIDGIVIINPLTDVAVIKLKDNVSKKVELSSEKIEISTPIVMISSKTSVGLTIQKGLVLANDGYLQTSIPLSYYDEGSPLFTSSGSLIGMNTSKQINSSISYAINYQVLKEIQDKFNNVDFNSIKVVTFDELKEEYYYIKSNDEIISNNISNKKWNEYSKIGNIKETIKLKLLKASYDDNVVSLRYENTIKDYISSMDLALSFKNDLINSGYKEILDSETKAIYQNNKYKVIIMEEFNYLIIVMVKL